ncbi:MAG: hypothetical protein JXR95_08455 [Deltaproteobacteria bacterium]|nr:hypothetical protein [Deltaproteobacteria bacterium]
MDRKFTKNLISRLAFGMLMIGVVFLISRFHQKDVPKSTTIIHSIKGSPNSTMYNLNGKITDSSGEEIWFGEFKIKGKSYKHSVKLPDGEYRIDFMLSGKNVSKEVSRNFSGGRKKLLIEYNLSDHVIEH